MKLKTVTIAGHYSGYLQKILSQDPKKYDAIVMTDVGYSCPDIKDKVKSFLNLEFQDVMNPSYSGAPTKADVEKALEWARDTDPEELIVACHAGVSRSSAIAVLVAYQAWEDLDKAFAILDKNRHHPNELIMKYGQEILDQPVLDYLEKFLNLRWITESSI